MSGEASGAAATEVPTPCPFPGAQVRPLVKVLLPHVAAIQHEDIKDVDCTDFSLGLPLEGQVHCPLCQALAWDHSAHHSAYSRDRAGSKHRVFLLPRLPAEFPAPAWLRLLSGQRAEALGTEPP